MSSPLTAWNDHFVRVYRDRPYFTGLRARLLAAFALLLVVFVPLNVAKVIWVDDLQLSFRLTFNAVVLAGAALALRAVWRGRLELAGGLVSLPVIVAAHLAAAFVPLAAIPFRLNASLQLLIVDTIAQTGDEAFGTIL